MRPLLPFFAAALLLSAAPFTSAQGSSRPAITGIAFARFSTTEPDAAQQFYGKTLGYQRVEANGLWIYPVNRSQWIEVDPKGPPPAPNVRMEAVGFTTRDAAGLEKYLQQHGVAIEQPLAHGQFAVHDPEGNLVYFVQAQAPGAVTVAAGQGSAGSPARIAATATADPNSTSRRLIHVGYMVEDRAREDAFWSGVLGFRPYWHGGMKPGVTDWASLQVPDGTDWLEYMLNSSPSADLRAHGGMDHISLGTRDMQTVEDRLKSNGCEGAACGKPQMGRDGKVQLNLHDPDLTRIEFMEYTPRQTPCCSPILGKAPGDVEDR